MAKTAGKNFKTRGERRWMVAFCVFHGPECMSCVGVIARDLRRWGFAVTNEEVAMDIGWLETNGYVSVTDARFKEGRVIKLETPGFEFFRRGGKAPLDSLRAA